MQPIIQVSTGQTPPNLLDFDVAFGGLNWVGVETEGARRPAILVQGSFEHFMKHESEPRVGS